MELEIEIEMEKELEMEIKIEAEIEIEIKIEIESCKYIRVYRALSMLGVTCARGDGIKYCHIKVHK